MSASPRWPLLAYLGLNLVGIIARAIILRVRNPGLLKERLRPGRGAREGYYVSLALYVSPRFAHYVLATVDIVRPGRFSRMPAWLQASGLVGFSAASATILWAMAVNPFFSSAVRIQRERGHRVVSAGPYRLVRHPSYLAYILLIATSGLALGSWRSLLPLGLLVPALVRRTCIEDRMLREELDGYLEYAERVRFRLLPGIW
jgi:protein-S-isoprenylcysteine O-methyltransferase Ste14